MNIKENVSMAFTSIKSNKLRSLLTMLGIIIGISSVITITTIGNSISHTLSKTFNELGINTYYVYVDIRDDSNIEEILDEDNMITNEMIQELISSYPNEFEIIQYEDYGIATTIDSNNKVKIVGSSDGYFDSNKIEITNGRKISQNDNLDSKYTIVVSDIFAKNYFGVIDNSILGKTISVSTSDGKIIDFSIVGIYEYSELIQGKLKDNMTPAYVPYNTMKKVENVSNVYFESCNILWNTDFLETKINDDINDFFQNSIVRMIRGKYTCRMKRTI